MFMAHFDVVPVNTEEWRFDPFKLTKAGDRVFGRGSADDKGNVAGVMLALKSFQRKNSMGGFCLHLLETKKSVAKAPR